MNTPEYLHFVDKALDGMARIVTELGDDLANQRPDIPGANSPYVILTHCLGVMACWGGQVVGGREIHRDRPAEFTASCPVADLVEKTRAAKAQLAADVADADADAPPRTAPGGDAQPWKKTQGGVLLHLYEELAQHHGHMEITRDVLLAPWAKRA
jgi:hypothetical protein